MHSTDIEYVHDDLRLPSAGWSSTPTHRARGPWSTISATDAAGLGDHPRHTAQRLAELGFVAFASTTHHPWLLHPWLLLLLHGHHGRAGALLAPEQVGERFGQLVGRRRPHPGAGRSGLEVLLASGYADPTRVAAIGYCFGGTLSLERPRSGADLAAVVGFHSGLATTRPGRCRQYHGQGARLHRR